MLGVRLYSDKQREMVYTGLVFPHNTEEGFLHGLLSSQPHVPGTEL